MAFDSTQQRTILFGGQSLQQNLNDTWEWDGRVWVAQQDTTTPSVRVHRIPSLVALPVDLATYP